MFRAREEGWRLFPVAEVAVVFLHGVKQLVKVREGAVELRRNYNGTTTTIYLYSLSEGKVKLLAIMSRLHNAKIENVDL